MTLSTQSMFSRASQQMQDLQAAINKTQVQISTGQQLTGASDDPQKSNLISGLQLAIDRQDAYAKSVGSLSDRLKGAETALTAATKDMARLKQLAVQAANDTLSTSDRAAIGLEVDGIRHDLQSLAATRDVDGNYLFSGTRMTTAPFESDAAGGLAYGGDQVDTSIEIGEGRVLTLQLAGPKIFTGVRRDGANGQPGQAGFFQVIDDFSAAVKTSDAAGMQRGLAELDTLADGLTLATARVGSYQKQLDSQQSVLDATKLQLQSTLSSLRDSDYTEAITRLQQQTLSLQAAQGSFARTADLNLFNFLK